MNAIRLDTVGPKGDPLDPYMQLANLLNAYRAEYRKTGQTGDFQQSGNYVFSNGQTRKIEMDFVSQANVMPGLYAETVTIDGDQLPNRHHLVWSQKSFWGPNYDEDPFAD